MPIHRTLWCVVAIVWLPLAAAFAELEPVTAEMVPPALDLPDLESNRHSLASYAGRVVLVNFWGTWCSPCLQEMPSMQRLKEAMTGAPFAMLAVNVKQPAADAKRYAEALGVDFTILLDQWGQTAKSWKVRVYPTSYLIDSVGRIRYRAVGALEWDDDKVIGIVESLLPAVDPAGSATTSRAK